MTKMSLLERAVIDASGTWRTPAPLGAGGYPLEGELNAPIVFGPPDSRGAHREREVGVLVIGRRIPGVEPAQREEEVTAEREACARAVVGLAHVVVARVGRIAEAAVHAAREELEARVRERTAALEQAEGVPTKWRRSVLLVLAITLHNIPEGLAVGADGAGDGRNEEAPADAIVMGSGRIEGRPVMVAAEDFTVKAGERTYRAVEGREQTGNVLMSGMARHIRWKEGDLELANGVRFALDAGHYAISGDGKRQVVHIPVDEGENTISITGYNEFGYLTERSFVALGGFLAVADRRYRVAVKREDAPAASVLRRAPT